MALESLRQPLEEGAVTIGRSAATYAYPARFALVASMNPCPCGFRGTRTSDCRCDDAAVARYVGKLSGRCSIASTCTSRSRASASTRCWRARRAKPSAAIRARVEAARALQLARYDGAGIFTNAGVPGKDVRRYCALGGDAASLLRDASARGHLSARALDRIARVAARSPTSPART